ncbi:hypothetical protein BDV10DRAFT_98778 [Aspergillus recurvatus]
MKLQRLGSAKVLEAAICFWIVQCHWWASPRWTTASRGNAWYFLVLSIYSGTAEQQDARIWLPSTAPNTSIRSCVFKMT